MKQILVAVDFSDLTTSVIDHAVIQAKALDSGIFIIHVQSPPPAFLGNDIGPQVVPAEQMEEESNRLKQDMKAMADYLEMKNIAAACELLQGPIAETILEKATEVNAEMIIMGAHTHGFLYRAFIGSVSTAVLKHAPCPVLVIPAH
jgi:nucleotide-binding universal stress UspA family protein